MRMALPCLVLVFIFVSSTFSSTLSSTPSANGSTFVLDMDGNKVENDTIYNIVSAEYNGSALGISSNYAREYSDCPPYIVVRESESLPKTRKYGLNAKLFPANSNEKYVSLSSDLNIWFKVVTICVTSIGWKVHFPWNSNDTYIVGDARPGNPGADTVYNWFKLEKYDGGDDHVYKIVFCPNVCPSCKVTCGNVGVVSVEDGEKWLGLTKEPLPVKFRKM